ncbi:hypothetical protein BAUCODRAFT_398876 [Baudoinia panamericana UAMH 10762]|uniref:DUF7732 domain-containing protein n=1 Tax=Baudoinia panamericana (strain UAMH 10762) TaxID=717646 RepID=M2MR46_BAUPA|nr:uncharacterized protein BAUCODRAFT_398876 [Baudoinia panamericana UAMH 10762]EMC99311.1 hypothetical protein BAUCODRAFT_398876 [Baudoinia panamericana UAMH 10762]
MKIGQTIYFLLAFITTIHALALPSYFSDAATASQALWKRKGGGGRGGGSSSGSSGSSGSTGSSGSSGSTGGSTTTGSGVRPAYGAGGRYYGGGAATPYTSGSRSPGGIAPYFLAGSALAFFPGIWLYGAYAYAYPHPYTYHNNTSNQNQTLPVECLCGGNAECGCDSNNDTDYINTIANNNTVSRVADVNGTQTLVINGTLDNGTTASGGTESANAAGSLKQGLLEMSGWWIVVAGAVYTAFLF